MNKLTILISLIIFLINGCKNTSQDPLNGLVIGSNETIWKNQLKSLVDRKKLTCIKEGRSYYGCIFDSTYVDIQTNTEFEFGKLLDYKIDLSAKPEVRFADNRPFLPFAIHYRNVYNTFQRMIQLYGNPDSIINIYPVKVYKSFTEKPFIDSLIGGFKGK